MNNTQRKIVVQAIIDDCEYREYKLLASNYRSNHIHVVVQVNGAPPEEVISRLKAYATRYLRKEGYFRNTRARVWTKGGSTRYLFTQSAVNRAIKYVNAH